MEDLSSCMLHYLSFFSNASEASFVYLQVKRVMNGVFHSLRGEFDLSESYSGQAVLGVIVSTIKVSGMVWNVRKEITSDWHVNGQNNGNVWITIWIFIFQNVTLQLLSGTEGSSQRPTKNEEEAEDEGEEQTDDVKQREETPHQNVHVNGEREVKEEAKEEEEHVAESDSPQVCESQVDQEVEAEKETEAVAESKTQSQAEALEDTDLHPVPSTEPKPQETAAKSKAQQEQAEHSAPKTFTEKKDTSTSADPDVEPAQSSPPEAGQEPVSETNAAGSSEGDKESVDSGEHVGETNAASLKAFGPPANPPPPPNALQNSSGEDTRWALAGTVTIPDYSWPNTVAVSKALMNV